MLLLLIKLKVVNINSFDLMQKIIKFIFSCILYVSEFKAENIGVFILEFFKVTNTWQDEKIWEEYQIFNFWNVIRNLVFQEI
jgi:hypothetical protein